MNQLDIIRSELGQPQLTMDHNGLLNRFKQLILLSRNKMVTRYGDWDKYDAIYRATIDTVTDESKKKVSPQDQDAPKKLVVPIAFAQIQTFVAFGMSLLLQKEFFFELIGSAPEDFKAARAGEALLQRDLDYNQWVVRLNQFLLDIGKFGMGVIKTSWTEEHQMVKQDVPGKTVNFLGMQIPLTSAQSTWVKTIKYQGNRLENVSPYRFFPDPRMPLSRFQEGEFIASETDYSYADLKKLEDDGVIFGLEYVQKLKLGNMDMVPRRGFANNMANEAQLRGANPAYVVTELQVKLIPAKTMLGGQPIGEEDFPIKYLVWYANDNRIIRLEPLNYTHDMFTYIVAELQPDMNHFFNAGWCETIEVLQDTINWFLNSHIASVRKVLTNRLVVDPEGLEMDDLKNHRAIIRVRPGLARQGIDRWIKQLDTMDTTQQHVRDADEIKGLLQEVTGINDSILGQFSGGRRSAAEARNVMGSASSRLKALFVLINSQAFERLGKQMLSNLRDGLTMDTYVRMFGQAADPAEFQQFKKVTKEDLIGDYDFGIFDTTLPSEKSYQADVLKEFLIALLGSPEAISLLGLDPKLMAFEIMRNKGIRYPERFAIVVSPQAMAQAQQQQLLQQNGKLQAQPGSGQGIPQPLGDGQTLPA